MTLSRFVSPSSIAAMATEGFEVEPMAYVLRSALFQSGVRSSLLSSEYFSL